ncbi:MAG: lytic transglycosylase domain-containing protein [Flavobacteriaceae bacterium]
MKTLKNIFAVVAVVLISFVLINASSTENTLKKEENVALNFCGEAVPMEIPDVWERFDREMVINRNLHASTELVIKRANRYFPVIEPILAKYGVPDDFKYLAVIESKLENAVSPAGARGIWQFMPATAKEYGLEVNDFVDERYHLEKSTEAACKYLLAAKEKFGNWTLAAASYNGGMNGITRQIERQKVSDFYDLLLTEETFRYVFRILALKEIMQHPEKYAYVIATNELYPPFSTQKITVDSPIENWADFAQQHNINYKTLKIHNPWLRDISLPNKAKKIYYIEIPTE